MVALLRGINVGGKNKVPMAELRALATRLGWSDVATFVNSGNLVGTVDGEAAAVAAQLARALATAFVCEVPVVVRRCADVVRDVAACPFADGEPAQVHVGYGQSAVAATLVQEVARCGGAGERVAVRGGVLWIDFVGGVARSKLTSSVLDRVAGMTITLRNLNTARAIAAMPG